MDNSYDKCIYMNIYIKSYRSNWSPANHRCPDSPLSSWKRVRWTPSLLKKNSSSSWCHMEWRTLWTVKISCPNSAPHQHITEKTESAFAVYNTASQQQETSVCYQHFFSPKTKTASFQMPQRKKKTTQSLVELHTDKSVFTARVVCSQQQNPAFAIVILCVVMVKGNCSRDIAELSSWCLIWCYLLALGGKQC